MGNAPSHFIDPNGESFQDAFMRANAGASPETMHWQKGTQGDLAGFGNKYSDPDGPVFGSYGNGPGPGGGVGDVGGYSTIGGALTDFGVYTKLKHNRYVSVLHNYWRDIELGEIPRAEIHHNFTTGLTTNSGFDDLFRHVQSQLNNISLQSSGGNYVERLNDILSLGGVPLWGVEYSMGKALAASDANDYIKPFNEKRMLDAYPHLKNRPVPVHIPGTGKRVDIPRNYVKGAGKALQGLGIVSAVASGVNDINRYNRGEITGVHLTVNLIMNGVGFIGPWGAAASIVYGMVEDHIW